VIKKIICGICAGVLFVGLGLGLVGCGHVFSLENFELTISADSTDLYLGEDVRIDVHLKNLASRNARMNYTGNFFWHRFSPSTEYCEMSWTLPALQRNLRRNEVISVYRSFGSMLAVGEYVLYFTANFYIDSVSFVIMSNKLVLSVKERSLGGVL